MPGMFATSFCSARITSLDVLLRSSRGFRLISMRPLFSVMFVPSTPMNDVRLSTSGFFRICAASACCCSATA